MRLIDSVNKQVRLFRERFRLKGGLFHAAYCAIGSCVQIVVYEGQDKNPEMCRVLLTHEVMCRYEHHQLVLGYYILFTLL